MPDCDAAHTTMTLAELTAFGETGAGVDITRDVVVQSGIILLPRCNETTGAVTIDVAPSEMNQGKTLSRGLARTFSPTVSPRLGSLRANSYGFIGSTDILSTETSEPHPSS